MTTIFRLQAYDLIIWGYFYIEFIIFLFKSKSLAHFTNLFLPHYFEINNKILLNYFFE